MVKRKLPPLGALRSDLTPAEAGTFRDAPQADFVWPSSEEAYKKAVPTESVDLIRKYRTFQQTIYTPESVFYPSCELDISPIKGFPNSRVILLDKNALSVDALKRKGIECLCMDISDYKPERLHDLLILLNPQYKTANATHTLAPAGYIIANNWHGNAQEMFDSPSLYQFVAGMQKTKDAYNIVGLKEALDLLKRSADHTWIFTKK